MKQTGGSTTRNAAARLYPEIGAGGFSHVDGTVEFYSRINALVDETSVVIDLGAGRGQFADDPVAYRRDLRMLRGRVRRVIGLDIDPAVLANPTLTEAHVISPASPLPIDDCSVDLLVSDFTFEHITDPAHVADEIHRVLRPGGWLCARTPNKWGYIGIGARAVPNRFHVQGLRRLQPEKAPEDTFNVAYELNTRRSLARHFPPDRFESFTYTMNNEPAYFANFTPAWRAATLAYRMLPSRLGAVLYVFLQKRA